MPVYRERVELVTALAENGYPVWVSKKVEKPGVHVMVSDDQDLTKIDYLISLEM
jgi:hypothetical protein